MPSLLTSIVIVSLALAAFAIGGKAILRRKIVLGSRLRGTQQTWIGPAAILQGLLFILFGIFLLGATALVHLNKGGELVRYFARRPGLLLILIGTFCLIQAAVSFLGALEDREGPRWMVLLHFQISRRLPALVLATMGMAAAALGVFELMAPDMFDQMGGRVLEMMYGIR
ncbi:MAG: hypothetical protein ONB48_21230 [candidate division KSB1 bacterium]|nr:hypothetical protein [candidate division KSB1 bacterium]MDZ7288171.1 hypothetical protein [candidate division KSB1 bacterium]MDZ7300316.1 hypothetical protein [candidate division KSB1 bacterium]MDZ7308678.1 hypothetical protein [candidate division KSB1 bacterium]MDZ7351316.1 hypothetical protein [candidate division KSB1 bacterium]